tara:strand:- start:4574 stop:5692 length:1119 start_codon:yes stop_codon:yes gene_type:complete
MQIPLLELTEQNAALEEEFLTAFTEVLRSGYYISGPRVARFEKALADYTDTEHAIAVSSGTDALLVALMALEIGPGDEVICPSFTFFATAGCVARLGATPVFVECCPETFNLRREDVEPAITEKTRAIIPVHLFGQAASMDGILELARERKLPVVEDAAQALGARDQDRPVGSMGDFGTFSFFPSKNLSGFGEGGAIVTNNPDLAHRCRLLRNHGMEPRYHHKIIGGNFRLDEIQAAMLEIKLRHLDSYAEKRQKNAATYSTLLEPLEANGHLKIPRPGAAKHHIWNQFTLRISGEGQRDALRNHLQENNVASEVYYPVPLHRQECFVDVVKSGDFSTTDQLAGEVLSIPVFPELKEEQLHYAAEQVSAFFS